MGSAFGTQAVTEKESGGEESARLKVAYSSMQGWRSGMEDAHLINLSVKHGYSCLGVFDGHGGKEVAQLVAQKFVGILEAEPGLKDGHVAEALRRAFMRTDEYLLSPEGQTILAEAEREAMLQRVQTMRGLGVAPAALPPALAAAAAAADDDDDAVAEPATAQVAHRSGRRGTAGSAPSAREDSKDEDEDEDEDYEDGAENDDDDDDDAPAGYECGCTAVVALIKDDTLWVANAGDSRCVMCRSGGAVALSVDHKPEMEGELRRIKNAGGYVEDGRVCGNLNLSRALGDFAHKSNPNLPASKQQVTALPEVQTVKLTEDDEFLVLACDGVWDVKTNQQVVDFFRERLSDTDASTKHGKKRKKHKEEVDVLEAICEELMDDCLAEDPEVEIYGTDNTTVVIALLKPAGAAAAADATVKGGGKKLKAASHAEARQNGNGRYTLRPKHT